MVISELSQYTGFLVRRAQQVHVALWLREVSGEVTSVQFGVLSLLESNPGIDQRTLGSLLQLDRSTIADLVTRLEGRGYLERVRDSTDRRRNVMTITAAGRAAVTELQPRVELVNEIMVGHLAKADQAELNRLLALLLNAQPAASLLTAAATPLSESA